MKKAGDEMRRGYKRSDFAKLERGKFHAEVVNGTAVALLDPAIAKAFPTSRAVNGKRGQRRIVSSGKSHVGI